MNKIREYLNKSINIITVISFSVMVIITTWQVITRYLLKNPSPWSEELVSYIFAWMCLLGSALVVGERGHMNIPILVDKLKYENRKLFYLISEIIIFTFSAGILLYGGLQITNLAMAQSTSSLNIPIGIMYIILPISGILNIVYVILNIYDIFKCKENKVRGEE